MVSGQSHGSRTRREPHRLWLAAQAIGRRSRDGDWKWLGRPSATAAIVACVVISAANVEAQGGTIAGRAIDVETGAPIEKAVVSVDGPVSIEGQTDANGLFVIKNLPPSGYYLTATALEFYGDSTTSTVAGTKGYRPITFRLQRKNPVARRIGGTAEVLPPAVITAIRRDHPNLHVALLRFKTMYVNGDAIPDIVLHAGGDYDGTCGYGFLLYVSAANQYRKVNEFACVKYGGDVLESIRELASVTNGYRDLVVGDEIWHYVAESASYE